METHDRNEIRVLNSMRNIATSAVLQTVLGILSFVDRTIFIHCLSLEYLGLNTLFSNILNVLSMAELGMSSAIAFALYKPIAEKNTAQICSYMSFFRKAYQIIGCLILVLGICLSPFVGYFLGGETDISGVQQYFLVYLFGVGLTYFYSYKQILIDADQKKYINQIVICLGSILRILFQLAAVYITRDYGIYIVIYLVFNVGKNFVLALWADRLYPYLREKKIRPLEKEERKAVTRNIKAMSLHKFGEVAINSIDSILISALVDLRTLGLYANYQIITNALLSAMRVFYSSISASIGNLYATEDDEHVYSSFVSLDFANYFISSVITVMMFSLFQSKTGKAKLISGIVIILSVVFLIYRYSILEGSIAVSAPIFQHFNPFFVVALTPVSMAIFGSLARKGKEPSAPRKIGLGMLVAACGYVVMIVASMGLLSPTEQAAAGDAGTFVSPSWLVSTYLVLTFAELLLSPMGISFVSKVAPPKYKGMMMGGWFVATAIGNYLTAVAAWLWGDMPLWVVWGVLMVLCLLAALFIFSVMKRLEKVA